MSEFISSQVLFVPTVERTQSNGRRMAQRLFSAKFFVNLSQHQLLLLCKGKVHAMVSKRSNSGWRPANRRGIEVVDEELVDTRLPVRKATAQLLPSRPKSANVISKQRSDPPEKLKLPPAPQKKSLIGLRRKNSRGTRSSGSKKSRSSSRGSRSTTDSADTPFDHQSNKRKGAKLSSIRLFKKSSQNGQICNEDASSTAITISSKTTVKMQNNDPERAKVLSSTMMTTKTTEKRRSLESEMEQLHQDLMKKRAVKKEKERDPWQGNPFVYCACWRLG